MDERHPGRPSRQDVSTTTGAAGKHPQARRRRTPARNCDHTGPLRFLEHRIADQRIIRLIRKWLEAGVVEDGRRIPASKGTPQGAVISPLLANVYLHYAFDLWVQHWRKRPGQGDVIVVRYADDSVVGFEDVRTARVFFEQFRDCLPQVWRALHPDKTRLIECGRFAAERR